ncbi:hypothetical protein ABT255_02565 [Streptomyces mirabilis]|uniref:hypothetical protein n=1 Tax=Streptomyces mirabilis TaxID=68239 RepID=UPI00332B718A
MPDLPPAAASAGHRITRDEGLDTITLIPPHASTAQLAAPDRAATAAAEAAGDFAIGVHRVHRLPPSIPACRSSRHT